MTIISNLSRAALVSALGCLGAGGAFAQASWDLDACTGATQRTAAGFLGCGGTGAGAGGATVNVKAYTSTGGNFTAASINDGTTYIGVISGTETTGSGSPHHAIDNYTALGNAYELVHLQFSKAVDLSDIAATWVYGGAGTGDFQIYRWDYNASTPNPTITSFGPSAMGGWTLVKTGDFGANLNQTVSDGPYYSSHWLVSTAFGGSNDAFKLGTISSAGSVCATTTGPGGVCGGGGGGGVPEPASLALAGLALAVVARQRRRR